MGKNSRIWQAASFIFAIGLTLFLFPHLVTHPGMEVPSLWGDAGKNIFTYLYHILYGHGTWFNGMNYPYGEHITYTDAQPLLSVLLAGIKGVTIEQAMVVQWLLIGLSFVLATIYCFRILVYFRVTPGIALCFAGLITILCPQASSTGGHYALSYACVIPMLFYWTIKYKDTSSIRYPVFIFLLGIITVFLHPYFAAVTLIWVSAYTAGYFIFTRSRFSKKAKHVLPLLAAVIALFGTLAIIMKLTDPVKDRPVSPYGFLDNCTTGEKIFFSLESPVWKFANTRFPSLSISSVGEGCCYPGLVAIGIVLVSLVRGFIYKRKKKKDLLIVDDSYSPIWLFIAFSTLLLSMGVPFVYNLDWLLDYIPFLKQFRTLDRFSWIFYFTITIYAVVAIDRWFKRCISYRKVTQAYVLLLAAFGVWAFEASGYVQSTREVLKNGAENYRIIKGGQEADWNQFLTQRNYNRDMFQAILILRFFHVGSEKLWVGNDYCELGISKGAEAGLQLHLPIIDVMMSRSSWSQAEKQVKIAAGPFVHKPILDDVKSDLPFLLLQHDNDSLPPDQRYLLSASEKIGNYRGCIVYACFPNRIRANDQKNTDSVRAITPLMRQPDTCINCKGVFFVNHFDGLHANSFFGDGACPQIKQFDTAIATIPVPENIDGQLYEFSCWFLLSRENYKSPNFKLDFLDGNMKLINTIDVLTKESTDNHGLWFRSELYFTIPAQCRLVRCRLINEPDNTYEVMDELMLRPANALIIAKDTKGRIMVNNHLMNF